MPHEHGTNGAGRDRYALRIVRVQPGDKMAVRLLSERLQGLFTHFTRGRSVYCTGADCNPANHRQERFWKGYAAIEMWLAQEKLWLSAVREITEDLALDFRGRWKRGQIWELVRARQQTKKKTPVSAVLLSENTTDQLPEAFDLIDSLLRLYHVEQLVLDQVNPLPARKIVSPSKGSPPPAAPGRDSAPDDGAGVETVKRFRDLVNRFREGGSLPQ